MLSSSSTESVSDRNTETLLVPRTGVRLRVQDLFNALRRTNSSRIFETFDVVSFGLPILTFSSKLQLVETATANDSRTISHFLSCSAADKSCPTQRHQTLALTHLARTCKPSLTVRQNLKVIYNYFNYFFEMSAQFSELMERATAELDIDAALLRQPAAQVQNVTLARLIVFVGSHAVARHFIIDFDELDFNPDHFSEGWLASFLPGKSSIVISRDPEILRFLQIEFGIDEIHKFSIEPVSQSSLNPSLLDEDDLPGIKLPVGPAEKPYLNLERVSARSLPSSKGQESHNGLVTFEVVGSEKVWLDCQLEVGNAPLNSELFAIVSSTAQGTIEIPLRLNQVLPSLAGRVRLTLRIDLSSVPGDLIGVGVVLKNPYLKTNLTKVSKALLLKRATSLNNCDLPLSIFAAELENLEDIKRSPTV